MPRAGSLVLAAVVLSTVVCLPPHLRAEDVESLIKKGTDLRRARRDRDALTEFRKAAAIQETPRVLAQIALAEQALGIWVDAEAHLKKALAAESDPWIRKNADVLNGALGVIQEHLATVEVWGAPDGAEVLLDGKAIGRLPVEPARVASDEVFLEVRSAGYVTLSRTLHVKLGGYLRERVELRPAPAAPAPPPAVAAAASSPPPAGEPPAGERRRAPPLTQQRETEAVRPAPAPAPPRRASPPPLALEAAIGPRLVSRDLSWNKASMSGLAAFPQSRETALGFQLAWYPGAHFTSEWPVIFGLAASGEYVPSDTLTISGSQYTTSASDYWIGPRLRFPLPSVDFSATAAIGQHAFLLHATEGSNRDALVLPDVRYTYLRLGTDVRVRLPAGVSLLAGVAYRAVQDAGRDGHEAQSQLYFQRLTVTALDLSAAAAYRFLPVLEARLGFDLRRYGLDMHPQPSDTVKVSGGLDQYVSFWLTVAVLLDGVASGGGGS